MHARSGWDVAIAEARRAPVASRQAPKGSINWPLGETLFVHGELVPDGHGMTRVFPSQREIAERIGTSKENVQQRALRYDWKGMRHEAKLERMGGRTDDPPIITDDLSGNRPGALSRKKKRRNPEELLLEYLEHLDFQLQRGRIKADSIADLDKAVRTLAFVRGQADSRREVRTTVSLEVLQAKHATYRQAVATADEDEVAGVLGTGGGPAILDVEGAAEEVAAVDGEGRAYKADGSRIDGLPLP